MQKTESQSGVESENLDDLSADNPLYDPTTDRLGYAPFARYLADSIRQMTFPGSFIVGVYGSWGWGKTTLLNFIVHYLKQKPEDEQPVIVPFNPWLFSGEDDITRRFFDQIQSVLSSRKFVPKGFKDRIADLAKVVSEIPLPYAQAGKAVAKLVDDKEKDASDLKEDVEATLLQEHPRIIVTIDDIDRLDAEEIRKLFRVIKAFPNFTNVVYLLVFDKEIVVKALAETQGISGEAYLEKVIQVAFELPTPDKTLLRRLLFDKLNAALADTPHHLFNPTHWGNIYFRGIDYFIANPRDVVRLTNHLTVTYAVVKGEVNPVDFVAIESLRVFRRTVYDIIRKNPHAFAVNLDAIDSSSSKLEQLERFHSRWIAQLPDEDKEPVKRLLLYLFPQLEAVWGNRQYSAQHEARWRKQLRVCSLEVLPTYFRLALPEGEVSSTDIQAILASAQNSKVFGEKLVELANQKRPDGTTEVRTFLEQLESYTEDIALNCIPSIVQALFRVGEQLLRPEDEPRGMFDFGNDIRIDRIIWQLLNRLNSSARFEVLKAAMSQSDAVSIIVREVTTLGQQQGKYGADESLPQEEWFIDAQQLEELEELALKKVQDAAQQNSLLRSPAIANILSCWREWTSEEEVKQWVEGVISNDEGLANFLNKFLEQTISQSLSDMVPKRVYRLDSQWLEPYLDPSSIIDRARSLAEKDGSTPQEAAINQFIQEYEVRQQGEDPDDPNAREEEANCK